MGNRIELQNNLENLLGSRNVYFQPPENVKLSYDCIIYNLADISTRNANNKNYMGKRRYDVTLITRDPDSAIVDDILKSFRYIGFDRSFITDNLYHFAFTLYY